MMRTLSNANSRATLPSTGMRGFTLLELLAVIFIIGIILSFASLSVGQHGSRTLEDEAQRLHSLLQLAADESVLEGRELALQLNPDSYLFLMLDNDDKWQPLQDDRLLRQRELPPILRLQLQLEGVDTTLDDADHPARIFVLSSGEMTPFELRLEGEDGEVYRLQGDVIGHLELARERQGDDART